MSNYNNPRGGQAVLGLIIVALILIYEGIKKLFF